MNSEYFVHFDKTGILLKNFTINDIEIHYRSAGRGY